jgi:integrase
VLKTSRKGFQVHRWTAKYRSTTKNRSVNDSYLDNFTITFDHCVHYPPANVKEPLGYLPIGAARGLKQRVLLMTAYSAGLRVSELVNLKITDIDAARMTLRVKRGKGGKDRYAILSENLC